ncbi:MAG TPA: phosphatidate cytidylyltransferase [Chlamydiales bacterium]|nr:phosphatidate cytidylyltransferase [Chlamydiales bacterium]
MWKKLTNFQQRAILGTLLTAILTIFVLLSHTPHLNFLFLLLIAAAQAVALWEYYQIATKRGLFPLTSLGTGFGTAYLIAKFFALQSMIPTAFPEAILYLFAVTAFLVHFKSQKNAVANLATTLFGVIYVSWPMSVLFNLDYEFMKGPLWVIFLIGVTKMSDVFAYIIGKQFGRHKIAPVLSPKKTIEGALGGIVGAVITSGVILSFCHCFSIPMWPQFTLTQVLICGLLIGVAGIIGDLAESLLKRDAQVKDSNALPGFGGLLDMVDSVLFTAPLFYLILRFSS